jgi:heat-inducible transcriptional repressor
MQIEPGQVMLVVVTDIYETQSVLMELRDQTQGSPAFNPDRIEGELEILSNFLNAHLQGRALADLPALNWSELGQEFQRYADFLRTSLAELARRSQASSAAYTHILVRGVSEVLRQPEFAELQQVQTVLHVLEEEQDQLWSLFLEVPDPLPAETRNRVQVWIGSENPLEPMRNCALVAASYRRGSMPVGRVGMLGPTRMMYENAIAVVEAAADYLSDTLR